MEMFAYLHSSLSFEEAVSLSSNISLSEASHILDVNVTSTTRILEVKEPKKASTHVIPLVFEPETNSYVLFNY